MLSRAVAPVVVNPDMASKKATATRSVTPPVRKGSMPNRQVDDPSRRDNEITVARPISESAFRLKRLSTKLETRQMPIGMSHMRWAFSS